MADMYCAEKIDPRLISDEMAWRGKQIVVSAPTLARVERIFHSVHAGKVWCVDGMNKQLLAHWDWGRIIEIKPRMPDDMDARSRMSCRAGHKQDEKDWVNGVLLAVTQRGGDKFFTVLVDDEVKCYPFCLVEDKSP